MAGLFGSITVKGNRLTEFATQTASVGIPIPFGYGRFPCEGNIGFAPMPPKEHVKKKKQGKGGVKTEEYSYTLSYAIMFCEGPIFGYWTIKRNGKVVWTQDPNASVEDAAYAAKWAQKATFYYGTETQLPDSTIESYKGAGNVSAFRGIAYIVVEDDDVTDNGGAVPTYEAVVMATPPEAYLTSLPYPQIFQDRAAYSLAPTGGELRNIVITRSIQGDYAEYGLIPTDGIIRPLRFDAYLESDEAVYAMAPVSGEVRNVRRVGNAQDESVTYAMAPNAGQIRLSAKGRIEDDATYSMTPTGGTISIP